MEVDGEEKRIDRLFYFIPQHRYLAVEVKTGEFYPADLGQLQGYVAACDLSLLREGDAETNVVHRVIANAALAESGMALSFVGRPVATTTHAGPVGGIIFARKFRHSMTAVLNPIVKTPLPDISTHVIQTEFVWPFLCDFVRILLIIPCDIISDIASAVFVTL